MHILLETVTELGPNVIPPRCMKIGPVVFVFRKVFREQTSAVHGGVLGERVAIDTAGTTVNCYIRDSDPLQNRHCR